MPRLTPSLPLNRVRTHVVCQDRVSNKEPLTTAKLIESIELSLHKVVGLLGLGTVAKSVEVRVLSAAPISSF